MRRRPARWATSADSPAGIPACANVSFGDGSVHFLRASMAVSFFKLLGNRHDGEILDASSY